MARQELLLRRIITKYHVRIVATALEKDRVGNHRG